MYPLRMRSLLLVTFAAAVVAAGCGEGTLSSPTAPSALSDSMTLDVDLTSAPQASTSEDEFGALGGGNRGSGDKDKGKQEKDKSDRGRGGEGFSHEDDDEDSDDHHGRRRNLSGFVTAVGADSITVRGIVVRIMPATVIRHGHRPLTLEQIAVGDHAQAKGMMSADGTTLTASEVKVEDTGRDNDDDDDDETDLVELKGAVAGLPAAPLPCLTLTFTIGTTTVKTDSNTKFDDVTCAALANGNIVEMEGTRQADGTTILAKTVELD
jgi:hypothetical protein